MQLILKKNLEHQTVPIQRLCSIFHRCRISKPRKSIENPIIDIKDPYLYQNIKSVQSDLPLSLQKVYQGNRDYLNIDIKMETGTGKTYVYTKAIYELNKLYGFNKFIVAVPSLPIKAGTSNFIKNNTNHFKNVCNYDGEIKLQIVEGVKRKKGTKNYVPNTINEFVTSPNIQKNTIQVLLVNMQHLKDSKNGVLVRNDYDSHIAGYFRPIDAISATRPIVLIDEPHRFNRDKTTFKFIEEKIKPQMIVRFGATFPSKEIGRGRTRITIKDYENLIYDLNIHKAFEQNLIKGVAKEHVESTTNKEEVIKILGMQKGDYVRFQKITVGENSKVIKTTRNLKTNDSLSLLSPSLHGITIDSILSSKIQLSNGEEKFSGDTFFTDVFASSYVRASIQLSLKRHFEAERENFNRKFKIKTLALFFIDDIHSYRDNGIKNPYLRDIFEEELKKKLEIEIKNCSTLEFEYRKYLEASLENIKNDHVGYFSEDNTSSEAEIEKQVKTILFDKEKLLSLTDDKGNYNTTRFIFSKWTLKEGWDNPNIFTIVKLRSSGSEESKLQEIGRGLRLPVDETGNRIENETFTLNYIVDFTEKDFINKLEKEIYGDLDSNFTILSDSQIENLSVDKGISKEAIVIELLNKGYISYNLEVQQEKLEDFINEYPEVFNKLDRNKIRDRNKNKDRIVGIRKDKYSEIRDLWEKLNQKYYLFFDSIEDEVLIDIIANVVTEDLFDKTVRTTSREKIEMIQGEFIFNKTYDYVDSDSDELLYYGNFLKKIAENTNVSITLVHKGLVKASLTK